MASILDIADSRNRVGTAQLKDFIAKTSIADLNGGALFPFLISKELFEGEFLGRSTKSSGSSTLRFMAKSASAPAASQDVNEDCNDTRTRSDLSKAALENDGGSVKAIYVVAKNPANREPEGPICVGRAASNDIVIADFAISKVHAQILSFKGKHFIMDLDSTNGTSVDRQRLSQGVKVQLQHNSVVAFGRLAFVYAAPSVVLSSLRRELFGT